MIKAICLDMDDTLIVNRILYDIARAELCGYMRHFGVKREDVLKRFFEIDLELFKTLSYSRQRMPESFERVLKHFVPNADAEMTSIVRDMAETIFTTIADVKPGVSEALDLLRKHYKIYMITQGDKSVQDFRIANLPFRDQFIQCFVVDSKNPETYAAIAQQLGYQPGELAMVGDSIKSDILPSIAAGYHAFWIESPNSQHEAGYTFPEDKAKKFSSLTEVAKHLAQQAPAPVNTITPQQFYKHKP